MPIYCFSLPGRSVTIDRFYPIGKCPKSIKRHGKKWVRDIIAEHSGHKSTPGNWPIVCWSAGVHPSQRKEAMEYACKMGVNTHYNSDGDPVIESPKHYREFCRINGLAMKNAGYSDPAPRSR